MTLTKKQHLLICLENKRYFREVLLSGVQLAKQSEATFEVLFLYYPTKENKVFHLLNIAEGIQLSKKLGAKRLTLKKVKNERTAVKKIVDITKEKQFKKVILSDSHAKSSLWGSFISFDPFQTLLKKVPDTTLLLIHPSEFNPFHRGTYTNAKKVYLVKKKDGNTPYYFRNTPTSGNDIAGLFFQMKGEEEWNGVFAFFRNGRMMYLQTKQARIQYDEINEIAYS